MTSYEPPQGQGRTYKLAPNQTIRLEDPNLVSIYPSAGSAEFEVEDNSGQNLGKWTAIAEGVEGVSQGWDSQGASRLVGPIKAGPKGADLQVLYPGDLTGTDRRQWEGSVYEWHRRIKERKEEEEA